MTRFDGGPHSAAFQPAAQPITGEVWSRSAWSELFSCPAFGVRLQRTKRYPTDHDDSWREE